MLRLLPNWESQELAEAELDEVKKAKEENEALRKQIQEAEQNTSSQIEEANRNLRESERQIQHLKKEIQTLKEKVVEYEKKFSIEEEPKEEIAKDISASKATFLIHLYPRQGHYHGKIEHSLSRDKKVLSGLDQAAIFEFISEHLPQLAEEEKSEEKEILRKGKEDVSTPFEPEAPTEKEVMQEIRFQQLSRTVEPGHPLRAHLPFKLHTRLHFPVTPTADNTDIDTSTYVVRVVAKDADDKNVIARKGAAGWLSSGIADYENQINMSRLDPGKYLLKIYTIAPFAQLEESTRVEVMVE